MSVEKRIFGSGKAQMGAVGAALTDAANGIGDVQSASLDISFQSKDLMNTPEISMFPVLRQYYGGKVEMKINFENLDRNILTLTTGATSTVNGGQTILSITKTTRPGFFKFVLQVQDTDGNPVIVTIYNGTAPGLAMAFALDDYTKSDFTITGFPDPTVGATNGKVVDIASAT